MVTPAKVRARPPSWSWLLGSTFLHEEGSVDSIEQVEEAGAVLSTCGGLGGGTRWTHLSDVQLCQRQQDWLLESQALAQRQQQQQPAVALKTHCSKKRGRYVVHDGTGTLQPGTVVLECQAAAVVVSQRSLGATCHHCLQPLKVKASRCAGCCIAHYCSRDCMDSHAELHEPTCSALNHLRTHIGRQPSPPPRQQGEAGLADPTASMDLARLALDIMSRCLTAFRATGSSALLTQMQVLVSNAQHAPEEMREEAASLAELIKKRPMAKGDFDITVAWERQELTELLLRLRFNSHPVSFNQAGVTRLLGLFLPACAVNHSCRPNVAISFRSEPGGGVRLQMRCIRPVAPGEELCYSYLKSGQLYQPRGERRHLLQHSFLFKCCCPRCIEAESPHVEDSLARAGEDVIVRARRAVLSKGSITEKVEVMHELMAWLASSGRASRYQRLEASVLLLSLGQASQQHHEAVITATGMLDSLLCAEDLYTVLQRADLLVLRTKALAAAAVAASTVPSASPMDPHRVQACLAVQAVRAAVAIYAVSLGYDHPMTQGAVMLRQSLEERGWECDG